MTRKLYPSSGSDQFVFWFSIASIFLFVLDLSAGTPHSGLLLIGRVIIPLGLILFIYLFPRQSAQPTENEYSALIAKIGEIGTTLSSLSAFLEKGRQRVADTENVLKRLQDEKARLEPIVESQRDTVEAVLATYARRTASNAWRERFIGFLLGVLASVLANVIYEFFKH